MRFYWDRVGLFSSVFCSCAACFIFILLVLCFFFNILTWYESRVDIDLKTITINTNNTSNISPNFSGGSYQIWTVIWEVWGYENHLEWSTLRQMRVHEDEPAKATETFSIIHVVPDSSSQESWLWNMERGLEKPKKNCAQTTKKQRGCNSYISKHERNHNTKILR